MKAILMAAGRGTRISRLIANIPKCTLPIFEKPIIRRTVEILQNKNIETAVVVGYQYEKVKDALEGLNVKFYCNPFYDVTNSIGSLWLAKNFMNDDCILMNADVYCSEKILDAIIIDKHDVIMAVDKSRINVGDYFFKTANDCIKKYGKNLPLEDRSGEYVGIAKIKKSFLSEFKGRMDQMLAQQEHDKWWEDVLYSFAEQRDICTVDVNGEFWAEVDYYDDYERILTFANKNK
ncbi:MAG: cholinephosphate cytidylyltransferase [Phascolarctobacterium sp.]|nr:MAG: cholinephosphate cytidylyltransferase [Phascolarctobacterium sp.]